MIEKQKEEWKDDHYYYFGVVTSHFSLEILLYFEMFQKYRKMQSNKIKTRPMFSPLTQEKKLTFFFLN